MAILTAQSALMHSLLMSDLTLSTMAGSFSISRWASRIRTCSLATFWDSRVLTASLICLCEISTASSKRFSSSSTRSSGILSFGYALDLLHVDQHRLTDGDAGRGRDNRAVCAPGRLASPLPNPVFTSSARLSTAFSSSAAIGPDGDLRPLAAAMVSSSMMLLPLTFI